METKENKKSNWIDLVCIQDSAFGFLYNCILLHDKLDSIQSDEKIHVLYKSRLNTAYFTSLLFSIELFFKALLLTEGHQLDKIKSHKIYELYKETSKTTQEEIKIAMDDSGQNWYSIENILKCNNDISIRARYNDITKGSLILDGATELFNLAMFLGTDKTFNLKRYGSSWMPFLP